MRLSFRSKASSALFWLATFSAVLGADSPAQACSGLSCVEGDIFPLEGEVPSNALVWFVRNPDARAPYDSGLERSVSISRVSADAGGDAGALLLSEETVEEELSTDADVRYTLVEPVEPGTVLRVAYDTACWSDPSFGDFGEVVGDIEVTEPAPLPTDLGTLDITTTVGPLHLWNSGGGCTEATQTHYADVSIALALDAVPYADVLRYRLLVDGVRFTSDDWLADEQWPVQGIGGGLLGRGRERVYAVCDTSNPDAVGEGVTPGQHQVQLQALLPDGTSIHSNEVAIDLSCPPCSDASDGMCPANDGDAAPPTNEPPDASTPDADSGAALDASEPDQNSVGCNCVVGGTRVGHPGLSLLAIGVLAMFYTRRRQSPVRAPSMH